MKQDSSYVLEPVSLAAQNVDCLRESILAPNFQEFEKKNDGPLGLKSAGGLSSTIRDSAGRMHTTTLNLPDPRRPKTPVDLESEQAPEATCPAKRPASPQYLPPLRDPGSPSTPDAGKRPGKPTSVSTGTGTTGLSRDSVRGASPWCGVGSSRELSPVGRVRERTRRKVILTGSPQQLQESVAPWWRDRPVSPQAAPLPWTRYFFPDFE
eukprot:gene26274-32204_t